MKAVVSRLSIVLIKLLTRILARVEVIGRQNVPLTGAGILVTNHVNAVEPLLLYTVLPRHITALSKIELWDSPITGLIATSLGAIPLKRGQLDVGAIRQALRVLEAGGMMGVAPEGTRSRHGRLQRGQPGVVLLALRVPHALIVPVAVSGQEHLAANVLKLRRTPIRMVFGQGFYVDDLGQRASHELRQRIVDEIMMQIAALLPVENRGVYHELQGATERHLRFPPGTKSNLASTMDPVKAHDRPEVQQ